MAILSPSSSTRDLAEGGGLEPQALLHAPIAFKARPGPAGFSLQIVG